MDELVRDIAESFAFSILYENKYEYDESSGQIRIAANTTLTTMRNWGFLCDYGLVTENTDDYLEIDPDNDTSHLDSIAINYLHKTLKQLLIDVYNNRGKNFLNFSASSRIMS